MTVITPPQPGPSAERQRSPWVCIYCGCGLGRPKGPSFMDFSCIIHRCPPGGCVPAYPKGPARVR